MSIEAMKQALEALEDIFGKNKVDVGAINVLRQSIEQAEKQEPVAWLVEASDYREAIVTSADHAQRVAVAHRASVRPLYTAPPQRGPLTDERLRKMHHEDQFGLFCDYDEFEQIARAVERKHGIGA